MHGWIIWIILGILSVLVAGSSAAAPERELTIAVYQGPCRDGDFAANLAAARKVIGEAMARKCDFLAFPETFLSGYDSLEHVRAGARAMDDPQLVGFIEESNAHELVILIGLARKTEQGIHNSVLVIHGGKLLGIYDKSMLTDGDSTRLQFVAGTAMPIFEAHGLRFAVNVCHDTSFPHPALLARLKGAQLLFTPHYNRIGAATVDDHRRWVRNCHIALACQMKMVVARSNIISADSTGGMAYGDSLIVSPVGEVLAEAKLFREQLLAATIAPAVWRRPSPWADLSEVPSWMNAELGELMLKKGKQP